MATKPMAANLMAADAPSARTAPAPRPGILDIASYVPGTSVLPGTGPIVKLSSNETPLGPSPKAVEAYIDEAARLARYPDGSARPLREALAAEHGLDPARIVCGAGSDELLNLLAVAYLGPGDEAIYTEHGFLVYKIAILAHGATPIVAPETNLTADVDAILALVTARTRMLFLANPNNPTGTYLPAAEIERLHASLPGHVVLVLDGAYAEYVRRDDYEASIGARCSKRQRGDDADLLQDLRPRLLAHWLGLLPGCHRRHTEPHPRPLQRDRAVYCGRRRGSR